MRAASRVAVTGAWLFSAAMAMFFSAMVSALVIRRGLSEDWGAGIPFPAAIWLSTALLVLSSVFAGRNYWSLAAWTSGGFLLSQGVAWTQVGTPLSSGPAIAFFYLLTVLHAAHVAGGLIALRTGAARAAVRVYWHALTGLWMVILCLLLWGKS